MSEIIHCPKCHGTEHETNYTALKRASHWSVSAMYFLYKIIPLRTWMIRNLLHREQSAMDQKDASYIPEGFRCAKCGHHFLSPGTYQVEIQWAKQSKKRGLVGGFSFFLLAAVFLLCFFISEDIDFRNPDDLYHLILTIAFGFVSFIGFRCAVASHNIVKNMTIEWKEFSDTQAKYLRNHITTERLPAWKRVQMEQEHSTPSSH